MCRENEPVPEERTEGVKEMTLDEWKREQEAKRAVPKYNLRKPGEGEDGNQWKKLYMLKKKVKDEDDDEEEEDEEDVDVISFFSFVAFKYNLMYLMACNNKVN